MNIYVLPGFGGSQLFSGKYLAWVNYFEVARGHISYLKLADDGITPNATDGQALTVYQPKVADATTLEKYSADQLSRIQVGFVGGYYEEMLRYLIQKFAPLGHKIITYPYDFRLKNGPVGVQLGLRILKAVKVTDPCTIVAHSNGGLVARCAWRFLKDTGRDNLIRRIVTISTPHYGAYQYFNEISAAFWSLNQTMLAVNNVAPIPVTIKLKIPLYKRLVSQDISNILLTWPGTYELAPVLGSPLTEGDEFVSRYMDAANYISTIHAKQKWLDYLRDEWHPFLLSPANLPPRSVLRPVGGWGFETAHHVLSAKKLVEGGQLGKSKEGDKTVHYLSSLPAGFQAAYQPATHSDICKACIASDNLYHYIMDEIPPLDSPLPNPPTLPLNPVVQRGGPFPPLTSTTIYTTPYSGQNTAENDP